MKLDSVDGLKEKIKLKKRKMKMKYKFLIGILGLIIVLSFASYSYLNDYYRASDYVSQVIEENAERITYIENMTIIKPKLEDHEEKIALIFYPGGKVDPIAYMPLLLKLSEGSLTTVLVDMPANLAVFNIDGAKDVLDLNLDIDKWYLAGHSLGGAMASQFMEENYEVFEGLILLGAYPVNDAPVKTLAIYGSYDIKLDLEKTAKADVVYEILGGNHANFGDYGLQEGDGKALITREEQQNQAVEQIKNFIYK